MNGYPSSELDQRTAQVRFVGGVEVRTLAAGYTIGPSSGNVLLFNPDGSDRTITLPNVHNAAGGVWLVKHTGSSHDLNIVDSAAVAVGTVNEDETAIVALDRNTGAWVFARIAASTFDALTLTSLLLATGGTIDLNGEADALVLDADGNTSISAPTDDQIDIEIGGADDFRFLANIFQALSGSVIETNTINETTATNGVAVDGLTIKDGSTRPTVHADPGNGGAIPVTSTGVCALTSGGAETRTLADPTFLGQRLTLWCTVYVGDIVVATASPCNVANNNRLTFGAVSEAIELVAVNVGAALVWQIGWNDGVGLTTV